ncbi:protein ABHD11-like [Scaptodrosophila lebanonensis]|uniref:sn-1-specific diacylglycerol lipase ABHD11 n=1 Tax=Drosophila lebanonensis TaxID=7225 RepID=A0A6J2TZZ7_DROLE|nr:protein ABHD11-like [Scaptodrosophila lebanonensis]
MFESSNTDAAAVPVIIMHGIFGSKQNWRSICRSLTNKTKRRIYAVDARNHGDSPHTAIHSSEGMSADVLAYMKSIYSQKACLIGHSMGGRTMMYFALTNPQLTERLIAVDISPISIPRTFAGMNKVFTAMLKISVPPNLSLGEGRKLVMNQMKEATAYPDMVDFIMPNLRKKPDTGEFYWACNVHALRDSLPNFEKFKSLISTLPPYSGPTIFICGKNSVFVSDDHWPQILKHFPNAEIQWLDAGHMVHFEQTELFVRAVADFLNK